MPQTIPFRKAPEECGSDAALFGTTFRYCCCGEIELWMWSVARVESYVTTVVVTSRKLGVWSEYRRAKNVILLPT